jgi:hypothetical protein
MENKLIGYITPEAIEALKKESCKNGMFSVEVNGHIAYFKQPTRSVINMAMSNITPESQPLDYFESIAEACKVAGSDELLTDDEMFMELVDQLKEILTYKNAKLVKL